MMSGLALEADDASMERIEDVVFDKDDYERDMTTVQCLATTFYRVSLI